MIEHEKPNTNKSYLVLRSPRHSIEGDKATHDDLDISIDSLFEQSQDGSGTATLMGERRDLHTHIDSRMDSNLPSH